MNISTVFFQKHIDEQFFVTSITYLCWTPGFAPLVCHHFRDRGECFAPFVSIKKSRWNCVYTDVKIMKFLNVSDVFFYVTTCLKNDQEWQYIDTERVQNSFKNCYTKWKISCTCLQKCFNMSVTWMYSNELQKLFKL